MFAKNSYREIKEHFGGTQDATADAITTLPGEDIELICLSGNLWVNAVGGTAVADATAIKLIAGQSMAFCNNKGLSMISDGSGATYQIIVMGE